MGQLPGTLPDTPSGTAAQRYEARVRRSRVVYAAVLTVIVVVLGVVAAVAWSHGEAANATLRTAKAPAALPLSEIGGSLRQSWSTGDRAAIGDPVSGGTVVVYGTHTVRGVDARTGATTWSYTRSDRTICTVGVSGGVAMAVFRLAGNCDQVNALDAGTGARRWTRTLDMDGMPVTGTPRFLVLTQASFGSMLIATDSVVYSLDPSSGYNRWTYSRYGCDITGLAIGSQGALIAQDCTAPRCAEQKFCTTGRQLLLRDAYAGRDDKDTINPDKISWLRKNITAVPVSGGTVLTALDPNTSRLLVLDAKTGATTGSSIVLSGAATRPVAAVQVGDTQLVRVGSLTLAFTPDSSSPAWSLLTSGPPTAVDPSGGGSTPTIGTARITVASVGGAEELDGRTGRVTALIDVPTTEYGTLVRPLGGGLLVITSDGTQAFA